MKFCCHPNYITRAIYPKSHTKTCCYLNILTILVSESSLGKAKENVEHLLTICQLLSVEFEKKIDQMCLEKSDHAYTAPVNSLGSGRRMQGRLPFDISKDQLLYLSSLSFRLPWHSAHRYPAESTTSRYKSENPHLGEVMVLGRICSLGYKVTRERLRHAIRQTASSIAMAGCDDCMA